MKIVDARGYACPQPVIMTKKALENNGAPLQVLVDSKTPLENVTRFATNAGFQVTSKPMEDGEFEIIIQ